MPFKPILRNPHDHADLNYSCGFRILSRAYAGAVLRDVPGGRYETEMEIVIKAVRDGHGVAYAPIATRYEAGNPSSHFRKIGDSFRIYKRLLTVSLRHRR